MLDYRLEVFRAVAEQLNFTRAAETLHISQPAVTQHIKHLEEHYRVALFRRGAGGIALTPAGQLLYEASGRAAELSRQTAAQLRRGLAVVSGPLRLGASTTVAQYFLPPILGRFQKEHPQVAVTLRIGNTRDVADALRAGRLDLGLVEGPGERGGLRAEAFYDDEIVCVAAPGHPLAQRRTVTPAALREASFVLREPGSGTRDVVERALRKAGVAPAKLAVILETDSSETIKGLVATGVAVAFLSRLAIRAELQLRQLVVVPVAGLTIPRQFHFIHAQGPRPAGPAGRFCDAVRGYVADSARDR